MKGTILPNYGVSPQLTTELDRLGVGYAFDDFGQLVLTDAFVSPAALCEVVDVATLYDCGVAVADSVVVIRRDDLAAVHLNHHPYVHVV